MSADSDRKSSASLDLDEDNAVKRMNKKEIKGEHSDLELYTGWSRTAVK